MPEQETETKRREWWITNNESTSTPYPYCNEPHRSRNAVHVREVLPTDPDPEAVTELIEAAEAVVSADERNADYAEFRSYLDGLSDALQKVKP